MRAHQLKCWPRHFQAVFDGRKPFELRINDRDFQIGDTLILDEWQPAANYDETKNGFYTGRQVTCTVTYILNCDESSPEFVPDGWIIMGLKKQYQAYNNEQR